MNDYKQHNTTQHNTNETTNKKKAFCTRPPSGNQVDGLLLALHKDAGSASWPRSGRACERKIYKKMYAVDENFDVDLLGNHQKVASYHIKAWKEASRT